MILVEVDADHVQFNEMRKWCISALNDYDENDEEKTFYCYPPKVALDKPARFKFYNHEAEMLFAMRYNNGKNNYKATRQE